MSDTVIFIGHSHLTAVRRALDGATPPFVPRFFSLSAEPFVSAKGANLGPVLASVAESLPALERRPALLVSMVGGNEHNTFGLLERPGHPIDFVFDDVPDLPIDPRAELIPWTVLASQFERPVQVSTEIMRQLRSLFGCPMIHVQSPPPLKNNSYILRHIDPYFKKRAGELIVARPWTRLKLWLLCSKLIRQFCNANDISFVQCPPDGQTADGFLRRKFYTDNATHANREYGKLLLDQISKTLESGTGARPQHPYMVAPPAAFWAEAVAQAKEVQPLVGFPFRISHTDRVATAGSCFAQHLSRHLAKNGFDYFVTERAPESVPEKAPAAANYGVYSARFGNLYTSRQLVQLLQRAYGKFVPADDIWAEPDGRFIDPYRPAIQPGGFAMIEEFTLDRERHFTAVRRMVEEASVFVFTLGLTECWENATDGAVYPLCPGVRGGRFDEKHHRFRNLTVQDVVADLEDALAILRAHNPNIRVVLTVSPVPLKATASGRHVLAATTYSKAVLRVAAENIATQHHNVGYFPSYEIITGPASRGRYFAQDLRSITEEGVAHVMRVFLAEVTTQAVTAAPASSIGVGQDAFAARLEEVMEVICEEEALGMGPRSPDARRPT